MKKIYSLGNGFIANHLPNQIIDWRIYTHLSIESIIESHKPDILINCIGYCGKPNVDACESNKEKTAFTNTVIPIMLAEVCKQKGIQLIQIGSGCIYFGNSPNENYNKHLGYYVDDIGWEETDFANPKSHYSKTKYACDLAIGGMDHVTTLRIRMPISNKNDPRNLINKLKQYKQIIDIPNSVTFIDDLVRCVDFMIQGSHTGIYHVTNLEQLTANDVMEEYKKYHPDHSWEIINENQLDKLTIAKRSNCKLNTDKLNSIGFYMTDSEKALEKCMKEYHATI